MIIAYARTYRNVSAGALTLADVGKIEMLANLGGLDRIETPGVWYISGPMVRTDLISADLGAFGIAQPCFAPMIVDEWTLVDTL